MRDKIASLEAFEREFRLLRESERAAFSRVVNELQNQTFIVKEKEADRGDYLFLRTHKNVFEPFFELIDFEFVHDPYNELFYIKTSENRNRLHLSKAETAIVLILRQLYYLKKKEVTSEGKTMVTLSEIVEKLRAAQLFRDDIKITVYREIMMRLRQYSIVDYVASRIDENTTLQILPSIQVIVPQDKLEDIIGRLNALKKEDSEGGEDNENADED